MSTPAPTGSWRRFQDLMKAKAAGMDLEGCVIVTEERDLRFSGCEVRGVVLTELRPLCAVCGLRDCDHVNPVPGCVRVEAEYDIEPYTLRGYRADVVRVPDPYAEMDAGWLEWELIGDLRGAVGIEEEWDE